MKLTATALALLVLGFGSSYALAKGKPPKGGSDTTTAASTGGTDTGTTTSSHGKGHGKHGTTTGMTTTTSGHGKKQAKVVVCHKAGKSGKWVKITVPDKAAQKAHLKHGDVLPAADGSCPAPTPKHTTTGAATTTTVTTTAK